MKKKNILVTGGAGFIGSHLIEELLKDENNKIISLDNYFTGKKENHIEGAKYIEGHTKDIESLITEIPDIVYHLGEYSRVFTSFEDIDLVANFNQLGTFKVLEFCRKNKVRLIYAGSSTKFGEFNDEDGEGKNQAPYIFFKANNTDLVKNYALWFGLDYAITYFYNVYGGREIKQGKYATIIGILTDKKKKKEKFPIVFPGTQKRAFTFIEDIVRGIILVGEKGKGDGYCIGPEKTYSLLEIAEMFGGEVEMLPERRGDRKFSKINLSKMKELGWVAQKDIKDYIDSIK